MLKRAAVTAALVAVIAVATGCGGTSTSGAPDVTGGPASDSATLFKASNLDKVLPKVKSLLGGPQVTLLKIEPRDVKAVGTSKTVTVDYNNNSLAINIPGGFGGDSFNIAQVNPSSVQKAVSGVESSAGVGQSGISYVAITNTGSSAQLLIYLRNSTTYYSANIDGIHVKKGGGGGGSGATGSAPATGAGGGAAGGSSGSSLANCLQAAGTDESKIKACMGQ